MGVGVGGGGRGAAGLVVGVVEDAWMCSTIWNVGLLEKGESSLDAPVGGKGDTRQ